MAWLISDLSKVLTFVGAVASASQTTSNRHKAFSFKDPGLAFAPSGLASSCANAKFKNPSEMVFRALRAVPLIH